MSAAYYTLSDPTRRKEYDERAEENAPVTRPECPEGKEPMGFMRVPGDGGWTWLPVFVERPKTLVLVVDPILSAIMAMFARERVENMERAREWGGLHGPHTRKFIPLGYGDWERRSGLLPLPPSPSRNLPDQLWSNLPPFFTPPFPPPPFPPPTSSSPTDILDKERARPSSPRPPSPHPLYEEILSEENWDEEQELEDTNPTPASSQGEDVLNPHLMWMQGTLYTMMEIWMMNWELLARKQERNGRE